MDEVCHACKRALGGGYRYAFDPQGSQRYFHEACYTAWWEHAEINAWFPLITVLADAGYTVTESMAVG